MAFPLSRFAAGACGHAVLSVGKKPANFIRVRQRITQEQEITDKNDRGKAEVSQKGEYRK